ncbi:MAG: hypothetical protein ACRDSR_13825, partial [Pseudonocardiaceae bacterium]
MVLIDRERGGDAVIDRAFLSVDAVGVDLEQHRQVVIEPLGNLGGGQAVVEPTPWALRAALRDEMRVAAGRDHPYLAATRSGVAECDIRAAGAAADSPHVALGDTRA